MKRLSKTQIVVAMLVAMLIGCDSNRLGEANKQLRRTRQELAETREALNKAETELARYKEIVETLISFEERRKAERKSINAASLIGLCTQPDSGQFAISAYILRKHEQRPWCGPVDFP